MRNIKHQGKFFCAILLFTCCLANLGLPSAIAQESLVIGTVVQQSPQLPQNVKIGATEVPVTWEDLTPGRFSTLFDKVIVKGRATIKGTQKDITATVWIFPEDLVYLIDAGRLSPNASEIYEAAKALRGDALLNELPDKKVLTASDTWGYIERNPDNDQRVNVTSGRADDWATSFLGDDNDKDEGLVYRLTLQPGVYKITVAHVPSGTATFASWLNVNKIRMSSKTVKTTVMGDSIHPPVYVTHELRLTKPSTFIYETQKTGGYPNAHISLIAVEQIGSNVAMPLISPVAGDYWEHQSISFTHPDPSAKIFYTLDGSRPDQNSMPYTTPFAIDKTTRVNAIAYVGPEQSKVLSKDFAINTWATTATAFKLAGEKDVNNVKVHWEQREDMDRYKIYRDETLIGEAEGNVFDDYGLEVGKTYTYRVEGFKNGQQVATTVSHAATAYRPTGNVFIYENRNGKNNIKRPSGFQVGNRYYAYEIRQVEKDKDGNGAKGRAIFEKVSSNGLDNWTERQLAFYPHPINFEGVGIVYNKETKKVIIVAHYEDQDGYVAAKLYLAQITPGGKLEETFADRPLGYDSRDQSMFIDDDNTAYILSATNTNEDVNIYRLDATWSKPVALVNTIFKGKHRETPYITKKDGEYYFFSSKASGWYPSQAMYASATDLAGVWTQLRELGNNSTFGAQANSVGKYGEENESYGMYAYHWGAQYHHKDPDGNYPRLLYVNFNAGYASMDYYSTLEYHEKQGLIPVQAGKNLTLGKPVTATNADAKSGPASAVTDGAALQSSSFFKGGSYPYTVTIDMEKPAKISEINFATKLTGGSETAYKYTIEGSVDGNSYETLFDHRDNWQVGFQILKVENPTPCRYIRVTVYRVVNVHNNNAAEWADGIMEITAFGDFL